MTPVSESLQIAIDVYEAASVTMEWQALGWVATILLGGVAIWRLLISRRTHQLKKTRQTKDDARENESLVNWFQEADVLAAQRDYVVPYCSNVDPSDQEDLRNTVGVRQGVFDALNRELDTDEKRHILVLADSGMGKTTLLLNLVAKERSKRKSKRRRFALVPLGQAAALTQIESIEDKRNTILLLDAFDEDARAIEDAQDRMAQLMTSASAFKAIVMTCRTQFFASDNAIPRETGIKRVAARRAGVPIVYQWRTVYLQPFDRTQIEQYVRRTIPWHAWKQKKKARQIIAQISDLAARPMLTALIPDLSASKAEVHGLWDLYVFMVESWANRERGWIDPLLLKRISKEIAVDLVLGRSERGSERISSAELRALQQRSNEVVETWKLTSRSLLNRDSDGFYKFAHRSILEFFYIQALVDGDNRCIGVRWTDMMCQLFLSWGSSAQSDLPRALEILAADLRATYLFPINERHEPSPVLEASWIRDVFAERSRTGKKAKLPGEWRASVSHYINRGHVIRAYDLAEGLVWQMPITNDVEDRNERAIFRVSRFAHSGTDPYGNNDWSVSDLYELHLFCEILSAKGVLHQTFDERELYWLIDSDGFSSCVARVRSSNTDGAVSFPGLELIGTASSIKPSYFIDVYKAFTRGKAVGTLLAIPIMTYHGDAEAIWHRDSRGDVIASWSIKPASLMKNASGDVIPVP